MIKFLSEFIFQCCFDVKSKGGMETNFNEDKRRTFGKGLLTSLLEGGWGLWSRTTFFAAISAGKFK